MGKVALNLAGHLVQLVQGGTVHVGLERGGPVIEIGGAADERPGGDHGIGVKATEEQLLVAAISGAALADQAFVDVLLVEQGIELGLSVRHLH